MYARGREVGITLITISHRQTLWQYHDFLLRFEDESGGDAGKGQENKAKRKVTFSAMTAQQKAPSR